ncbi:MAG TPA: hypothetical protein VN442_12030 [Bryobacteraceae bacterium]|nr:hypothetical protein [Bryobacteraceae bacterium]
MSTTGQTPFGTGTNSGFALQLDSSSFVTKCCTVEHARALPPGSIVGDMHGGLTFTDDVAAALESRSLGGWQDIEPVPGERWTIIVLTY